METSADALAKENMAGGSTFLDLHVRQSIINGQLSDTIYKRFGYGLDVNGINAFQPLVERCGGRFQETIQQNDVPLLKDEHQRQAKARS